jgi:hypothetical protein
MATVLALDVTLPVNLVDMACCRPGLRAVIEQEGVAL